jgi:Zn-dependent M28 family amino/carboxypeptidase
MDHDVLKMYGNVTNVIMRINTKNPPSGLRTGNDAILLGSHIDSTLPAPGAADDGMGVGVMLDIARVLVDRNDPFEGEIIFLWNGAEETLQDGSHMYSVQHETAKTVRAVINLEAAGTSGGALLFQATSREMIEAYSHAPHPRGTVIAADVFASGILLSE